MYFPIVALAIIPAIAFAVPNVVQKRDLTYDASNPITIFNNASCTLSQYLTNGEPLSFAFPTALELGVIVTPVLNLLIGDATVDDLDDVADQLCVNAQEDPAGGNGICQNALQAVDDFAAAHLGQDQVDKYKCLLDLLCVAHTGVPYDSTCDYLLAGMDCIANRIIGATVLECT